jgi:hypothetical protein
MYHLATEPRSHGSCDGMIFILCLTRHATRQSDQILITCVLEPDSQHKRRGRDLCPRRDHLAGLKAAIVSVS